MRERLLNRENTRRRVLFFDLDGTLAADNLPPSPKDVEALRRIREKGHLLCLCTGRSPGYLYPGVTDIGFDAVVASGGVYVSFGDRILFEQVLDADIVACIMRYFLKNGVFTVFEGFNSIYLINPSPHHLKSGGDWPITECEDDFAAGGKYSGEQLHKFTTYTHDIQAVKQEFAGRLDVVDQIRYAEVGPVGHDKLTGMRILLDEIGIPLADCIAFGDSANDIPMLRCAGIGVAMGGSRGDVVSVASDVTASLAENGVSLAIERFEIEGIL